MNLHSYYDQIIDQFSNKNYVLRKFSPHATIKKPLSPHLETLNYLMYEWCGDHNDERYKELFDYIIVPNDCDFDFTSITFEEFFKFLVEKKI